MTGGGKVCTVKTCNAAFARSWSNRQLQGTLQLTRDVMITVKHVQSPGEDMKKVVYKLFV